MMISSNDDRMLNPAISDSLVHLDSTLDSPDSVRVEYSCLRPHSQFVLLGILDPLDVILYLDLDIFWCSPLLRLQDFFSDLISEE